MNEYLLSVMGAVLLSSVLTAVLPEGKTRGLIQGIARLVCVLAIISPILQYLKSGDTSVFLGKNSNSIFSESVIQSESSFIKYYSEMRVRETENALEKEVMEKYGRSVNVSMEYELQEYKIKIKKIRVTSKEEKGKGLEEIREYLIKNYCKEVLIE